jgi:hypothetical protein
MANEPLRLSIRDAEDLAVMSSMVQDALTRSRDMSFQERERRFLALLDRFMWERDDGVRVEGKLYNRVRSVLHFDDVSDVQTMNIDLAAQDEVLELLAVAVTQSSDVSAQVDLVFAGGGIIRLNVGCIECRLADQGSPWVTRRRPEHLLDTTD